MRRCACRMLGLVALAAACASGQALAFTVDGAIVDLAPLADGGELDLTPQLPYYERARAGADPTPGLVALMGQLPTAENRRAAFAWIVATSRRPAHEGLAGLYALIRAGETDPRALIQAAVFAQSRGASGHDLSRWAAAAGLSGPALSALRRFEGGGDPLALIPPPAPAAAGGG